MPIRFLPVFITCILFLNACTTSQAPAPVEQYGVNLKPAQERPTINATNSTAAKFGILLPLTGPNATLGQSMLQAAQLTLFDQGATALELIPFDTKGTFIGGRQAAEQALEQDVDLIIGPIFSDAVKGTKEVTVPNNVKIIAFSNNSTLADRVTFLMGFMPSNQTNQIADYAIKKNLKRFAIIAPQNQYGELVAKNFEYRVKENGGLIVNKISYLPNDPAIQSKISTLLPESIDAVFIPSSGADLERISQSLTAAGLTTSKVKRLGTALWDNSQTVQNKTLENGWFANAATSERDSFERQYEVTYGSKPMALNSLAYDATALATVMAAHNYSYTSFVDPNGFSGIDGVFRFSDQGIIERQLAIHEIKNGKIIEIESARKRF